MIKQHVIEEIKDRLVKAYNPLEIYLFGSYAWGTPSEESDLDLLIVIEKSDERRYKRQHIGFDALWGLGVPKDLFVYTKEEFEQSLKDKLSLCSKIKKEGKVLYARA
jgi:predicted nucleotidyltransferase